ncbi:phosphoribosylglycinamide formyltransferase [Aestuariivirga litoralis]|uniref:phosphoribosylglycinamide formyltransferase n=1 Tax=Aestuariivirga litoralis TaxID=2650924 RepID=UPI001AEDFD26
MGVLISGTGSNMKALVAASRAADSIFEIACVVSNKADAAGITWAKELGVATQIISHRDYPSREAFDAALNDYMQAQHLDAIACAGFMRVMTPVLVAPWAGKILNIHPSLLPLYKGLHTHERAIAAGEKEAGCTVHLVTAELDDGPILAQARVPVLAGDTPESLAARVLLEEHKLYPKALSDFLSR